MSTFHFLVCSTRIRSARLPRFVFPALGSMVGAHAESTASSIQCPKVRQSPFSSTPLYSPFLRPFLLTNTNDRVSVQSHVPKPRLRRNGNLPNASTTQKGELYQARLLPHLLLLLSIPVHSCSPLVLQLGRIPPYILFALSAFVPVM